MLKLKRIQIVTLALCLALAACEEETTEEMQSSAADSEGGDSEGGDSEGGDSEGGDSEGGDSEGSDSEGSDSEGGDSEGSGGSPTTVDPSAGSCSGTPTSCSSQSWAWSGYPDQSDIQAFQSQPCFLPGVQQPCFDGTFEEKNIIDQRVIDWESNRQDTCELIDGCEPSYTCEDKFDVGGATCDEDADETTCGTSGCQFLDDVCRLKSGFAESTRCRDLSTETECDVYSGQAGCSWGGCSGNQTTPCNFLNQEAACDNRGDCYWVVDSCQRKSLSNQCTSRYYTDFTDYTTRQNACQTATCDWNAGCVPLRNGTKRNSCKDIRDNPATTVQFCLDQPDCELGGVCAQPNCSELSVAECGSFSKFCELRKLTGQNEQVALCQGTATACEGLASEQGCEAQGCTWTEPGE
ncbi:MAG: hypothetical protein MK135_02915 [Polyangiaceae bacterium]|nr:hypothetical protein [Polyangiaceae bacterium]